VSQRGKSARLGVLHEVAGSLAALAGFARRSPGRPRDRAPREIIRPGRRPLGTNLTFASLVAREWLRRRLPATATRGNHG
jgi:hypothetical protein